MLEAPVTQGQAVVVADEFGRDSDLTGIAATSHVEQLVAALHVVVDDNHCGSGPLELENLFAEVAVTAFNQYRLAGEGLAGPGSAPIVIGKGKFQKEPVTLKFSREFCLFKIDVVKTGSGCSQRSCGLEEKIGINMGVAGG